MLPSLLSDTYYRYKSHTNDIATWLAITAQQFGFSANLLNNNLQSKVQKSQRLNGKARKRAKETSKISAVTASKPLLNSPPKYTIAVKDFIMLAEYLASNVDVHIPAHIWISINEAILLRKMHSNYHTLQQANSIEDSGNERHSYFLEVLVKVKEVLKPRLQAGPVQTDDKFDSIETQGDDIEGHLDNMFAVLTVEEPSEEFLNTSNTAARCPQGRASQRSLRSRAL